MKRIFRNNLFKIGGGNLRSFVALRTLMIGLVLVLAGLNACNKEMGPVLPTGVQNNQGVYDREGSVTFDPISLQALNHTSNEEYEYLGRTIFEHDMYFPNTDIREYFPAEASEICTPERIAKFKNDFCRLRQGHR